MFMFWGISIIYTTIKFSESLVECGWEIKGNHVFWEGMELWLEYLMVWGFSSILLVFNETFQGVHLLMEQRYYHLGCC